MRIAKFMMGILWTLLLAALMITGLTWAKGYLGPILMKSETTVSITDLLVMLTAVSQENKFVLYRMAVSDRQDPEGFALNEKGEVDPEGKLLLDYIGVCEVEAWIPMDQVRLGMENSTFVVRIPPISTNAIVNYQMSFVWHESKGIPNEAVPAVIEAIRNRAAKQAEERDIVKLAQESAERWFTTFFGPFSETVEVRFES